MFLIRSILSDPRSALMVFLLALPGRLLAISAHEAAHGWVAERCGDSTARMMGRVTLNPLRHLDPIGLACMLLLGIGWAKPVPINPRNFYNYRHDDLLVSIAGITMNLILFLAGSIVYYIIVGFALRSEQMFYAIYGESGIPYYLMEMLYYFLFTNLTLAIFNLIPLPPLDGYHVLNDLVLKRSLFASPRSIMIGQGILWAAMLTGYLSQFLSWAVNGVMGGIWQIASFIYRLLGIMM